MDNPRNRPYIWVTWLTGLLAGLDKCEWKSWYKAHYRYAKRSGDDTFNLQEWTRQHDQMTAKRVEQLKCDNWTVQVEEQNSFRLDGSRATLSGKPDIIALRAAEKRLLVIDEKSGRPRESDRWQVLLYMFALPLVWANGWQVDGQVEYRGQSLDVSREQLTPEVSTQIVDKIVVVGGTEEPNRTPSASECRFCDIMNCPDRWSERVRSADVSDIF
jgi:hypothetical protein